MAAMFFFVHAVRQTARLGAGAAIAASPANQRAHGALAGIAHTQRPMAKDLDLRLTAPADFLDLPAAQLPGQHHPFHAKGPGGIGSAQCVQAHLGAGVQRHNRRHLLCQM